MNAIPPTGIEVVTKYVPMAFLFGFFQVKTVINGAEHFPKWGTAFYPLAPGRYTVGCSVNYMFSKRCGWNTVEVDLYAGQVVRVLWNAPDTVFQKGWMRVELAAAAPVQPPLAQFGGQAFLGGGGPGNALEYRRTAAPLARPEFPGGGQPANAPPLPEPLIQPSGHCGRCFAPLAPGAPACAACGASTCPGCGGLDMGTRTCARCGRQLRA